MSKIAYVELDSSVFSFCNKDTDTTVINSLHKDNCFFAHLPKEFQSLTSKKEPVIHLINVKYCPYYERACSQKTKESPCCLGENENCIRNRMPKLHKSRRSAKCLKLQTILG